MAGFNYGVGGGGSADLTPISQSFENVTELTVNHGLDYIPTVWVVDNSNNLILVSVTFGSGSLTFYSISSISGTIYIR